MSEAGPPGTTRDRFESRDDDAALLSASIYRRLQDRVLSGALQAGQLLSVPKIAAELGVSRSPVREAVQRLIHDGLAVHVPHSGARVVRLSDDDVRSVFLVRQVLDGLAARQAASRMSNADLARLRAVLDEQRANLERGADEARDTACDMRFHTVIREAAANPPLSDALARLEAFAHLQRTELWSVEGYRHLGFREHLRIVDALESGDVAEAARAAEAHVGALLVRMTRA